MAKTLKQLLSKTEAKPYDPDSASAGDKAFVAKHKVDKIADANGNDDDVFNATNVSPAAKGRKGNTDANESPMSEARKLTKKQKYLDQAPPYGKLTKKDFEELRNEETLEEGEVIQAKFVKKPPRKAGSAPASVTKLDAAAKEARDVARKAAFFKALTGSSPSPEDIAKWNSMVNNKIKESVDRHLHLAEASIKTISKKFYKNEFDNNHTENAILLAKHFGTPEEVSAAKAAKKARDTEGGYSGDSPHLKTVYEIHKKYGNKILPYEESK